MDRPTTRTEADARPGPHEGLVLPSRRPALDLCRLAPRIGDGDGAPTGPVLVTGDAGVGKTWLWRRLEAEAPSGIRWISVDLTPSNGPGDFYRLLAHELGLGDPASRASPTSRVGLVDFLAARRADGERISLVVEEAHNLSADLWEEVRVLANRLDRPGGFASMFLVGQTSLALRFSTRPFAAIEARLSSRVHLGPIDVEEAGELLARLSPGRDWTADEVEALHRDASGNPRRLLRMVRPAAPPRLARRPPERPAIPGPTEFDSEAGGTPATAATPSMPLTGPSKPPIRAEENMIEVGWSPEDPPATGGRGPGQARRPGTPGATEGGEEAVQDHMAALQAWREWAENQSRRGDRDGGPIEDEPDEDELVDDEREEPAIRPIPRPDRPTVRAEGEQKFAPFGHLFSRMAQPSEPE